LAVSKKSAKADADIKVIANINMGQRGDFIVSISAEQ
jgi:hypothetical protein